MPIVQPCNDNTGLFQIVLPQQSTAEQNTLKKKVDALIENIKRNQSSPDYATWVAKLQTIAKKGLDAPQADPAAAIKEVDALADEVAEPPPENAVSPHLGAFKVRVQDQAVESDKGTSWREIVFKVTGDLIPTPPEQIKLKAEIEATLTTLQTIFPDDDDDQKPKNLTTDQRRYVAYQKKLLGIAQTGLQTPADPESSQLWLASLQTDVLKQEGPRLKNGYMIKLGIAASILAALATVAYLFVNNYPQCSHLLYAYRNLFVLWTGAMIGAWLSFGIRQQNITFKDLGVPESDMVRPSIRLIFTGLTSITIAFVFVSGMVNVNIGNLRSGDLLVHGSSALLIGMLFGVSEQALPGTLTRRASQFVSEAGGKT